MDGLMADVLAEKPDDIAHSQDPSKGIMLLIIDDGITTACPLWSFPDPRGHDPAHLRNRFLCALTLRAEALVVLLAAGVSFVLQHTRCGHVLRSIFD
jgi:hypothetical protein